jgi:hypothetical protein
MIAYSDANDKWEGSCKGGRSVATQFQAVGGPPAILRKDGSQKWNARWGILELSNIIRAVRS